MKPSPSNQIKKTIKQLKAEKGIASKAVGDAKKNGQKTSELIAEVKRLSGQLKLLEDELKSTAQQETNINSAHSQKQSLLPSQFRERGLDKKNHGLLKIIPDLSDVDWDDYVNSHHNSTVYHTSAIRKVIQQTFGHPTHYLAAVTDTNEIKGVLPLIEMNSHLFGHFLVSVPFFNYGGVLATTSEAERKLISFASDLAKKLGAKHIEYRHCHDEIQLPSRSEKVAMLLTLPQTPERLWSDIGTKVRAQIKKSKRHGLTFKHGRHELVNDFYEVFSRNMRDLGTPVYSKSLFVHMLEYLPASWITVVYQNAQPVSGGFLVGWRDTLEIPWASTLKQANRFEANMYLYWEILRLSIEKSYKIFDFGRSSKEASTYRFKKQWGAQPFDLYWHYWLPDQQQLPQINPNNPKFKVMVEAWKRLPLPISNFIGPYVVKSIP